MSRQNVDLGSGSVGKLLFSLAVPTITSQIVNMLYNLVDRVYIGHMQPVETVGKLALTGVGVCLPIIMVISAFAALLAMGGAPRASIEEGRGNSGEAERIMGNCFAMLVIVSLVLTVVFRVFARPMLMTFGASENTIGYALDYIGIYLLGTIFVQFALGLNTFISAQGKALVAMLSVLIGAILNIVLDPIFIFVFNWGVQGAALATILSQILSAFLAFRRLTRTRACYRVNWRRIRFEGPMLRQVVTLGIPSGVQSSVVSLANVIVQANINASGCGAYSKIEGFAFLPVTCFALALSTFVSQNIGARRFDRVRQGMKFGLICSPVLAELIGVAIFTLAPFLIALFNSDPTVVSFGVDDARTVSLFYCLLSFSHCCAGILRGMGRPVVPMAIMLCVWCALRITYITVTVHFIPDIHVVYWAYPLTWAISSVLFLFCLRRMRFPSEEHGEPVSYIRG